MLPRLWWRNSRPRRMAPTTRPRSNSPRDTEAPDEALESERLPSGAVHYYLLDGLGSVSALSDTSGAKSQSYSYDPYGTTTVNNSTGPANPFRWTGAYQDPTGFYKMGARYYAPALLRWTQQDALEQQTDVKQLNRYAYVGGDPINGADPSGQQSSAPWNWMMEQFQGGSSKASEAAGAGASGCI